MKLSELQAAVSSDLLQNQLELLYGADHVKAQKKRYLKLISRAMELYGDREADLFSAPGRTEVGGNHTDHQLGRVLAASIDLDAAAVVIPEEKPVITYHSDAFEVKPVDLEDLSRKAEEVNTTESLIRGIAARYHELGYGIGGFSCYAESDVLPGSGMSSSAAFEILIAEILNELYNDGKVSPEEQAKAGQFAENVYFGKASGLMDQMACSVGGFITIDFHHKDAPAVERVPFDFDHSGFRIILTDCRASHADLSDEYSRIPSEMKAAAGVFGEKVLSRVSRDTSLITAIMQVFGITFARNASVEVLLIVYKEQVVFLFGWGIVSRLLCQGESNFHQPLYFFGDLYILFIAVRSFHLDLKSINTFAFFNQTVVIKIEYGTDSERSECVQTEYNVI